MMTGFACALVLILLTLGRDGRWLPLYGCFCAVIAGTSGAAGWLMFFCIMALLICNIVAWAMVRHFAVGEEGGLAIGRGSLPIIMTLLLQFVLALFGARLGLVPTLGIGLVLAGLCSASCGGALSQFCGLAMAIDGLLIMACILSSWGLFVTSAVLWGGMVFLAVTLLPRLAWRRVEGA